MVAVGRAAPSLAGATAWQQSAPLSTTQLRGDAVVVWFFSTGDAASTGMVPALRAIQAAHRGRLRMVGVHLPAGDADARSVGTAVAMAGITWPVALDHDQRIARRWSVRRADEGWPRTFVLDADGIVMVDVRGPDPAAVADAVRRVRP